MDTHYDVLVVGAGISGIGAGYFLKRDCPDRSFAILDARDDIGGTWDLFRYPGIRSDSDMHTLGYGFKPWLHEKSIADGPSIMDYLRETVAENALGEHIHLNRRAVHAAWNSADSRWTVTVEHDGKPTAVTCNFLFMCSGYYSYRHGHVVSFPDEERYRGRIVHPQQWPEDLDYAGKRVVIIGSGATAVTLVPSMAEQAAHVTMLQRSPTYVVSAPARDRLNALLRRFLPERWAYELTRIKNIRLQSFFYGLTRKRPAWVKKKMIEGVRKQLGPDFDVEKHFTPRYDPWDQRVCLVPDADLFLALKSGKASVVTDTIAGFTETGIALDSGEKLEADVIVTATGLEMTTLGEMEVEVDGEPVDFSKTWTYKGLAYSDVPNLVSTFGYINASWTLRADLTSEYVCRLLNHMRSTGTTQCTPRLRPSDASMPERPWIEGFSAGYVQRSLHLMPKQGDRAPWRNTQRYAEDKKLFREGPLDDGVMAFSGPGRGASRPAQP